MAGVEPGEPELALIVGHGRGGLTPRGDLGTSDGPALAVDHPAGDGSGRRPHDIRQTGRSIGSRFGSDPFGEHRVEPLGADPGAVHHSGEESRRCAECPILAGSDWTGLESDRQIRGIATRPRPDLDFRPRNGLAVVAENPPRQQSGGLDIQHGGLGLHLVPGQRQGVRSEAGDRDPHVEELGCRLEAVEYCPAVGSTRRFHPVNECVGQYGVCEARLPQTDDQRGQANADKRPTITAAERERPPPGWIQAKMESRRG